MYEMLLIMLLASEPPVAGPAYLPWEGVKIIQGMPDEFHTYTSKRCRELGLLDPKEWSPADIRAGGGHRDRLADVGFIAVMRGRYLSRPVPGDSRLPGG